MKHFLTLLLLMVLVNTLSWSNAVLIVNATDNTCFQLLSSNISVNVVNQVATVKSTQRFINQTGSPTTAKYAFPLYEDAAATGLRWKLNGIWHAASFSPSPADTTLPGTGPEIDPSLEAYLGSTALYFNLNDTIQPDSEIVFELTYVQLLHYAYNEVSFSHPNDYSLIQTTALDTQSLSMHIVSDRTIVATNMTSHTPDLNEFTSNTADVMVMITGQPADVNYSYYYTLNPTELGLFSFSTFLPDTISYCDNYGRGFFGFIVEPDPGDTVIIQKVFTLIIDRSGSMSGDKIAQARDAAAFIVSNLNEGDYFNIITFDSDVHSLFADHVPVTIANQNYALDYIESLETGSSTNISGSFEMAIPQFSGADPDLANIIIFMTDGQANVGISSTEGILDDISSLIATNDVEGLSINTFGIGYDANVSLLNQIATENNGISEFFSAGDLTSVITEFYLSIQNPVLLNTSMTFTPDLVTETYPDPLPNLYKGHQLVVTGRYAEPGNVHVTFSGEKYGAVVTYEYDFDLTDSTVEQNAFLTKLWAIDKINYLMDEYYTYDAGTSASDSIKELVTTMSLCYSVVSPFTSLSEDTGGWGVSVNEFTDTREADLFNYPNPFRDATTIVFNTSDMHQLASCVILDINGKVVKILTVFINGSGVYKIVWDGADENNQIVHPGLYPYYIQLGEKTIYGVMEKF